MRALLQRLLGGHEAEGRLIEEQTLQPRASRVFRLRFVINGQTRQLIVKRLRPEIDRKSTRLNSSHGYISYAVFCLKKKKTEGPPSGRRTHARRHQARGRVRAC